MLFQRLADKPFIARKPDSFYSRLVANPAVTEFRGRQYLFFRGMGDAGQDQIGCWVQDSTTADGLNWQPLLPNDAVVIPVSADANAPDAHFALDPAAIVINDALHVYYTSKNISLQPNFSISLAVSHDGVHFDKYPHNPLLTGCIAPEVVFHDGRYVLIFQKYDAEGDKWELFCRSSADGIHFAEASEHKILSPSGVAGSFDEHSLATARIFKEGQYYYMTYAGCAKFLDYPESIGLARSQNLLDWERYPHNPIFQRGEAGTWDEGALWFPTVRKFGATYIMWYEGAGSGAGLASEEARQSSAMARERDYGGYLDVSFSQIGVASAESLPHDW